jgi:hypothetical protein
LTDGNATKTAQDVLASEGLFRFAIVALVLIGYLAHKSGYVPKPFGVLLVIAGIGYLVDSFGVLFVSDYSVSVAAFTGVGEALFMIWLLVKVDALPFNGSERCRMSRRSLGLRLFVTVWAAAISYWPSGQGRNALGR